MNPPNLIGYDQSPLQSNDLFLIDKDHMSALLKEKL